MPAALLMAAVRSALRMAFAGLPWTAVFQGLDEAINQARGEMFVTGIVGHLTARTRAASGVGGPSAARRSSWTAAGGVRRMSDGPWGLDMEARWEVGKLAAAGESWSILCYTDGVTDARCALSVPSAPRASPRTTSSTIGQCEDLCQGLLSRVAMNPAGAPFGDDQTVLVLGRVSGRSASPLRLRNNALLTAAARE